MSRFKISNSPLPGLQLIERSRIGDTRGFLTRLFCTSELAEAGWKKPIVQINHTLTEKRGCVRGMHFQFPPHAETKLVSCIRGSVWDVAVDLRADSATFLQWHAQELSADNCRAFLIPEGFAHGFQALTDAAELLYCHSAQYLSQAEGGLNPRDEWLAIRWPLPITEISPRDAGHVFLDEKFKGLVL